MVEKEKNSGRIKKTCKSIPPPVRDPQATKQATTKAVLAKFTRVTDHKIGEWRDDVESFELKGNSQRSRGEVFTPEELKQIERQASLGCSAIQIARYFNTNDNVIVNKRLAVGEAWRKGSSTFALNMQQLMHDNAMAGDTTLIIHLDRTRLGTMDEVQRQKLEHDREAHRDKMALEREKFDHAKAAPADESVVDKLIQAFSMMNGKQ